MALNALLAGSRRHATAVALDGAIKGEDRAYQCGYAQALDHLHNDLERRRKG